LRDEEIERPFSNGGDHAPDRGLLVRESPNLRYDGHSSMPPMLTSDS
jgi:hypothetical protein